MINFNIIHVLFLFNLCTLNLESCRIEINKIKENVDRLYKEKEAGGSSSMQRVKHTVR